MKNRLIFVFILIIILGFGLNALIQFVPDEIAEREKWEEFLKNAAIVGQRQLGGENKQYEPWILTLEKEGLTRQAIWKNTEGRIRGFLEGWTWEIAAYRLDKHLGLNMVPPTVEKEFKGERGSCQLWVTSEMDLRKKVREKIETPNNKVLSWNRAIYLQRAFDNLIANIDGHQGSILITKDWRIILVDHTRSFGTYQRSISKLIYTEEYRDGPRIMRELPRVFVEKLKALDFELIRSIVGIYLTAEEIEAVLTRRDLMLEEIKRIIDKYGEDKVLY